MVTQGELREIIRAVTPPSAGLGALSYIYVLIDPRDSEPRYIGKSTDPAARYFAHLRDKSNCHRVHWLTELQSAGFTPDIDILETIEGEWPWQESERFWIAHAKNNGWRLTNNTDGGDGVPGLPAETRARMASVWLGRKHRPESLERIAAASRGRKHTPESRARRSAMFKGRVITWGAKLSEANRKFSPEQCVLIRERLSAGSKVVILAKEFNTSRSTITKIKKGAYR